MSSSGLWHGIRGHEKVKRAFEAAAHYPPAALFVGPSGVGKKRLAWALAQNLFCENQINRIACGHCNSCNLAAKQQHPDLLFVIGEGKAIKIENIREAQHFLSLRPFSANKKVLIIDQAHNMTPQAANSLLKALEEPPPHSYLWLVSSNPSGLLSTIHSRCQKFNLGHLKIDELADVLKEVGSASMEPDSWLLNISEGRVDLALLLSGEDKAAIRNKAMSLWANRQKWSFHQTIRELAELVGDRENALLVIRLWMHQLKQELERLASDPTPAWRGLVTLAEKMIILEQDIQQNVQRSLAFENFILQTRLL